MTVIACRVNGLLNAEFLHNVSAVKALPDIGFVQIHSNTAQPFDLEAYRGFKLKVLFANESQIRDLTPLTGQPLTTVWLNRYQGPWDTLRGTQLDDFNAGCSTFDDASVLANARLKRCIMGYTAMDTIPPLEGQPLEILDIGRTKVTDLSPLAGCKTLKWLNVLGTPITDYTVLKSLSIEKLEMDFDKSKHEAIVRAMPYLKTINNSPVAEMHKQK
ncbi:hypothetical protein BH11PLA2_BH11PLA2_26990 [soil metagenome]